MEIYFIIKYKDSEAYQRLMNHMSKREDKLDKLKEFMNELNLMPAKYWHNSGYVMGFLLEDKNIDIPEGWRYNKQKVLVPNRRTKKGKEYSKRMKSFQIPGASEFMKEMVGTNSAVIEGRSMRDGMGYSYSHSLDYAILKCNFKVWEKVQEREDFDWPQGLSEITASEYSKHEKKIHKDYD